MGNTYAQTAHVINHAIQRMCKVSTATKMYRGLADGLPSRTFLTPDEFGITGGVDFAPMKCASEETAIAWCRSSNVRIIQELDCGVDRAADVRAFSTYPEVNERRLPACTFLQVQGVRVRKHDGLAFLYIDCQPQFTPA